MSNFNPITDLRPVDQDRPSEISAQELQTMKVNLMETTMRTKDIVDVLIRRNSLLSRDIEKISDLKKSSLPDFILDSGEVFLISLGDNTINSMSSIDSLDFFISQFPIFIIPEKVDHFFWKSENFHHFS